MTSSRRVPWASQVRHVLRFGFDPVATAFVFARSIPMLLRALPELRSADRVFLFVEGGFGHTISAVDIFRRLYPGQRLAVVILQREGHNPTSALLWPDVKVIPLPLLLKLRVRGWTREWAPSARGRAALGRAIRWLATPRGKPDVTMTVPEVYGAAIARHPVDVPNPFHYSWLVPWADLLNTVEVPRARLPPELRGGVARAIEGRLGVPEASWGKVCCLYLRNKGEGQAGPGAVTLTPRLAGPFENYVPAIRFLLERGYVVLLTGGRAPPANVADAFSPRLVWAEAIGVEPNLFSLFAGAECDLWIGGQGGGSMLPAANRRPMLIVDAYPYGCGFPNARLCYKTLRDPTGEVLRLDRAYREHAIDWTFEGLTLHDNTPEELLSAVREFVEDVEHGTPDTLSWEILRGMPDDILDKHANVTLSRSWLQQHGPSKLSGGALRSSAPEGGPWPRPCCTVGRQLQTLGESSRRTVLAVTPHDTHRP
jgi:putative glycosyltransferase (TIGR04372 family)